MGRTINPYQPIHAVHLAVELNFLFAWR